MALHLAANGCYGVMMYNNRDYPDEILEQMLLKYGTIQDYNKGGKNLIFVYYKHYEEARACLDELQNTADFNAKPARPRETTRGESRPGPGLGKFRSKSMSRINFGNQDGSPKELHNNHEDSCGNVENASSTSNVNDARRSRRDDANNNPNVNERTRSRYDESNNSIGVRSHSVSRIDLVNANRRADIIKKVLDSEQNGEEKGGDLSDLSIGGSYDNLIEIINKLEMQPRRPKALPRIRVPMKEPPPSSQDTGAREPTPHKPEVRPSANPTRHVEHISRAPVFEKKVEHVSQAPGIDSSVNQTLQESQTGEEDLVGQPSIIPVKYLYDRQFMVMKKPHVVVIGGLPYNLTVEMLMDICTKFTRVLRVKMVEPKSFGEALRAYVYVENEKMAEILSRRLNKQILSNNVLIAFPLPDAM